MKEKEVKAAVVEAMNELPGRRDELKQMREKINQSLFVNVTEKVEKLEDEEEALQDEMSRYAEDGVITTHSSPSDPSNPSATEEDSAAEQRLVEISERLRAIKTEKENLLSGKAEYDIQSVHIRILLELIDSIEGKESAPYVPKSPACYDCADFFERTKEARKSGPVAEYSDDDMKRYVEKVVVYPEKMEVVFKAGVVIPIHR